MFQNNTNICCYTISLFHTHILSCRQRCPQALRAPWPLSFTGTSPVSPMASHPVGTLCWSDAPWAHQKDWKPHLLGSLHTPGMNPERKTDVSLAETYLSQGSYWPACLQTHPEDLTMTLLPLAVQQCHRVAGCEPLSRCHQVGPAGLHPRLCCVCIAVAAGLHHGVLQYAHSPFHLPCIIMGQKEFSQLVARQRAHRCPLVPVTDCTKPKAHRLPVPHWSESTCTAIGVIRTALS